MKKTRSGALGCPARCSGRPECEKGKCRWLAAYLARQKWINAYARTVADRQIFRYRHPQEQRQFLKEGPCPGCSLEKLCDLPCPEYVRWWDLRMALLRRRM